jgi:hypothetical protein
MRRRHYGIELTKSQAERHFDKVVWKTFKTRVHVLCSGPFHVRCQPVLLIIRFMISAVFCAVSAASLVLRMIRPICSRWRSNADFASWLSLHVRFI